MVRNPEMGMMATPAAWASVIRLDNAAAASPCNLTSRPVCRYLPTTTNSVSAGSQLNGRPCVISRHRQFVKNLLHHGLAGLFLGLGFVGDGHAVTQDVHADAFYVLRRHVAAALEERKSLGRQRQIDGRARRRTQLDEFLDLDFIVVGIARGADEVHNVIL